MVGWGLIALNARHCLDVKTDTVWIVQTPAFVMLHGKELFVINLIVGEFLLKIDLFVYDFDQ